MEVIFGMGGRILKSYFTVSCFAVTRYMQLVVTFAGVLGTETMRVWSVI